MLCGIDPVINCRAVISLVLEHSRRGKGYPYSARSVFIDLRELVCTFYKAVSVDKKIQGSRVVDDRPSSLGNSCTEHRSKCVCRFIDSQLDPHRGRTVSSCPKGVIRLNPYSSMGLRRDRPDQLKRRNCCFFNDRDTTRFHAGNQEKALEVQKLEPVQARFGATKTFQAARDHLERGSFYRGHPVEFLGFYPGSRRRRPPRCNDLCLISPPS